MLLTELNLDKSPSLRQCLVSLSSSLAFICIGLARAWASTAIPSMVSGDNNVTNPDQLTTRQGQQLTENTISWIIACMPLGAIAGSLSSTFLLRRIGRRLTVIVSGLLFLVSFLSIGLSQSLASHEMVLVFRTMSGAAVGLSVPAVTIYIGETVTSEHRGVCGSLPALLHAGGVLASYLLGTWLPWHTLSFTYCVPALLLTLAMAAMPESPLHLAHGGHMTRAEDSLMWLRVVNRDMARKELDAIINPKVTTKDTSTEVKSTWSTYLSARSVKPFIICLVLQFVQQWCGIHVIVFKTVHVFRTFQTSVDHNIATIIVGAVAFAATFVSLMLVERAGRRLLLIISGVTVTLSMSALALYITNIDNISLQYRWIPLLIIIIAFIGFSVGLATIPLSLIGELLPARTKNVYGPLTSAFNLLCLFLVLKNYVDIAERIEYAGVYWLFSGISLFGVLFVILFLPETRGKSLQEIENYFN